MELSPKKQLKILASKNAEIHLAKLDNLSPEIQLQLANSDNPDIKLLLARNPNLTAETELVLFNTGSGHIRQLIACRTPTAAVQLEIMKVKPVTNRDHYASYYLIRNPNLIPEIQTKIYNISSNNNKLQLAVNPNLAPKLFKTLFRMFPKDILNQVKYNNFKYKIPETQEQLEVYLSLM